VIPRVAGSGQSFQGAGLYYLNDKQESERSDLSEKAQRAFNDAGDYALHDKNGLRTAYRVGFTATLSMDAGTAQEAIGQMTASYDRYREKEAHKRGRKLTKPVYVYSLAWAPNENPSQNQMMSAARSSLKALRLEGLQTLIVQHTDEPHPHIHIIVNRIEQDGSRARNIPFDHLRFSAWAEQYERDHGGIRCEERVKNNALRAQGIMVRDTRSFSRAEYTAREQAQRSSGDWHAERQAHRKEAQHRQKAELGEHQAKERDDLEKRTRERISREANKAKADLKRQWRQMYVRQRAEAQRAKQASQGGIFDRAVFVFTHKDMLGKAGSLRMRDIAKLCLSEKALRHRVAHAHRNERAKLGRWERTMIDGAAKLAWRDHGRDAAMMGARHERDRDALQHRHRSEWQQLARERERLEAQKPPGRPEMGKVTEVAPKDVSSVVNGTFNASADAERSRQRKREALRRQMTGKRSRGNEPDWGNEL